MRSTREELRAFLLEALNAGGWNQFENLLAAVGRVKANRLNLKPIPYQSFDSGDRYLERGEKASVNELIWSLIFEGIISPGIDDANLGLPFLHVTEYGTTCLEQNRYLPHDPEGYLRDFRSACPSADSVIEQYLTEALQCYLRSLHKATAVMLGCASEQAMLLLINAWLASVQDAGRSASLSGQVTKATSIFKKFELFQRHLPAYRSSLPHTLAENIDSLLVSVFDLIRNSRNDAGHPARMAEVSRDANYAHLRLFVPYCARIYGLMGWLSAHPT